MMPVSISHIPPGSPFWVVSLVIAGLALHIGGGLVGIGAGYGAVLVRKGERLHRRLGSVFVVAMFAMALAAIALAATILQRGNVTPTILFQQRGNVAGGVLAFYLVATAWMAVRRKEGTIGGFEKLAALAAVGASVMLFVWGTEAAANPAGPVPGAPPQIFYAFASFTLFAAALDVKVILRGGVSGAQRIARHLWRMCFALFFAAASFFIGQQKVMPKFLHGSPVLYVLGLAPLAFLVFWLFRVGFSRKFRGETSTPRGVRA